MFKGAHTALITPFKGGQIDEESFRTFIDFQISEGIHGLVPVGTTGESPTLSHEEHKLGVEVGVQQAEQRVPRIGGTGSNNTEEAIDLTRHAESAGADAALVVTPYYNKPTQKGLYSHFEAISKSTKLPIIIYNIPGRSIVDMSTETMKSLFKIENIVGVKDATSNIPRVYESKTVIGENFNQLTGDDATTLAFMTYGGHGSISVTSNIAPKLCSQFMQLCLSKDFAEAAKINDKLMPLHHALFVESSPGPVKYAASKLGLCGEEIRLPLTLISDETKVLVDKALKHASLI